MEVMIFDQWWQVIQRMVLQGKIFKLEEPRHGCVGDV